MKQGELLRDLFFGFQDLLCNYEVIFRKSSPLLCVSDVSSSRHETMVGGVLVRGSVLSVGLGVSGVDYRIIGKLTDLTDSGVQLK